jgi:hypothetical protein
MARGEVDPGTQMALGLLFFSAFLAFLSLSLSLAFRLSKYVADDVHLSIVVCCTGNGQHEQSADCWGTALSVTPDVSPSLPLSHLPNSHALKPPLIRSLYLPIWPSLSQDFLLWNRL